MTPTVTIAPVRKSVVVVVDPARAFEVFTAGFDRWWPKRVPADPARRDPMPAVVESVIEPCVGGRWYSRCADGSAVDLGHVLAWEPARRLLLTWEFNAHWQPDASAPSEVEITFVAEGERHTRVQLEHRHFERMGKDGGEKMRRDVEGGWPVRLETYAREVERLG